MVPPSRSTHPTWPMEDPEVRLFSRPSPTGLSYDYKRVLLPVHEEANTRYGENSAP